MSSWSVRFLNSKLSERTSIFGLQLWVVVGTIVGAGILFVLYLLSHCLASRQRPHSGDTAESDKYRRGKLLKFHLQDPTPPVSKEISEILHADSPATAAGSVHGAVDVQIDIVKTDRRVLPVEQKHQGPVPPAAWPSPSTRGTSSGDANDTPSSAGGSGGSVGTPEATHLGWGRRYTLQELVDATGGLAPENVIGEGGYGIVYRGVLADNTKVAIKSLLNNGGQAEKEFKVEVEATGRVRHKNLVGLLGYCTEGAYRMLVYEYVDNGNLDQWLHGDAGEVSPLTWDIRVNIILGTAKGLAYLHEGLEPKVVHRDIKAGNLLLDRQWNPKLADFGLAKLICSERSHITTRVIGTFGYVAPEYASTGMLNERSDVYSFGVLIMEIISGRPIVDYTRPPGEVNLVEWLKNMVSNGKSEEVVDLRMPEKPPQKTFKRVLLVALRCVDPDAKKRPKMGHVVQMLEMDELLNRDNCKSNQLVHPH